MRVKGPLRAFILFFGACALCQCAEASNLRVEIARLDQLLEQAERNGARRCAPRELAIARSQLEFAGLELDQGFVSKARAHLETAASNGRAANSLSPPQYCAARGFAEPAGGDRDGDGLLDSADRCPEQAETYNGYKDDDGCPDQPDSDGDGLLDSVDKCPNEPEDADGYEDDDGCPDPDDDVPGR